MYYIGIHQDSNQSSLSLPLTRLLGVVKIRLAQINTDIGVIKNQIKGGVASGSGNNSQEEQKKLDRVVATFMDAVTKQIEAMSNTYNKEMNRYEKSITMLESAINMLHHECPQHAECQVEIARCKRLLAVNKKHLRGQWRQDAIEVDEVSLNQSALEQDY
jgi:fructose-1,6-bisphosphatase